jgi:glycosyltransferase involved in cell wall biosynthesis
MSFITLTIAIPTFNRPDELIAQLRALLPQLPNEGVELLVLDNFSDDDAFCTINNAFPSADKRCRLVRHPCNIGLGGNLLRAFELAQGRWVWLLGDDDVVLNDAVNKVLRRISNSQANVVLLKFGGENMHPPQQTTFHINSLPEMADYLSTAWHFSSMLFISTSVFQREQLLPHISAGYHWNYSVAPHLALLFLAMRDLGTVTIYAEDLVIRAPHFASKWNSWRLIMGVTTLGEIEGCEVIASQALPGIYGDWAGHAFWRALPAIAIKSADRPLSYWSAYFHRTAAITNGVLSFYYSMCAILLIPLLKLRCIKKLLVNAFGTRTDLSGIDRL